MIDDLVAWAGRTDSVSEVWVFGSRARGTARPDSDLDLALRLRTHDGEDLAELIERRAKWQQELTSLLGVIVKDIELVDDRDSVVFDVVRREGLLIFRRG